MWKLGQLHSHSLIQNLAGPYLQNEGPKQEAQMTTIWTATQLALF